MLSVRNLHLKTPTKTILKDLSFELKPREALAITGVSGVGKTSLGRLLAGEIATFGGDLRLSSEIQKKVFVPQQQDFRKHFADISYYQQRYDYNYMHSSPRLRQFVGVVSDACMPYYEKLKIEELEDKYLISLSNGEAKRVQLFKAFQEAADMLVLDNPFVGLDMAMRVVLRVLLQDWLAQGKLLVLICPLAEIPDFISKVLVLAPEARYEFCDREVLVHKAQEDMPPLVFDEQTLAEIATLSQTFEPFEKALELRNVTLTMQDRVLLHDINWEVKRGEKWALLGPNGSGKSTLLSLIAADNAAVYGQEVYVFDHKRGSGESIWDIKKRIGMVSPELHIYFLRDTKHAYNAGVFELDYDARTLKVQQVIASGLNDRQYVQQTSSYQQQVLVRYWMRLLEIDVLKDEPFHRISLGMQRIVLLARALVKNPPLLILDEPCQGLDSHQIAVFNQLVDHVCTRFQKTLIYVSHYAEHLPKCIEQEKRL